MAGAISIVSIVSFGFPGRLGEPARLALAAAGDVDPLRIPCEDGTRTAQCRFGDPKAPITYAIIGDSHAAAIRPAVEASAIMDASAGTLYWRPACPLLEGAAIANHPDRDGCTEYKQRMWQEIERNPRLETIILAGRWPYQIIGTEPESGGANRTYLIDDATLRASIDESRRVFERSLDRTLVRLHKLGRRVVMIGSIPEPGYDVPHNVAAALHFGRPAAAGISRDVVQSRMTEADTLLATIAKRHPDVLFLPIWQTICGKDACPVERGGVPIYYDDDHLSHRGATEVAGPALRQAAATARGLGP